MSASGVLLGLAVGFVLLLWVTNLILRDRLYVGYGVIFVLGTLATMVILAVPSLRGVVTEASVALVPVASIGIVVLAILVFLMVYVFTQITVLSNRLTRVTQELAIRNAHEQTAAEEPTAAPR